MTMAGGPLLAAGACIRLGVHGVELEVRGDVWAALDAVAVSYGAFRLAPDHPRGADLVSVGAWHDGEVFRLEDHRGRLTRTGEPTGAVLGLLDRVVMAVLERLHRSGILGTHAGAVDLDGRAVVLSGRSGRGKSTLTLGLVRQGAGWLTDELTLFARDDRTVLPYPRAMHVSPTTAALLPELAFLYERPRHDLGGGSEWSVTPEDLARAFGARQVGASALAAIVLLDGDPDPTRAPAIDRIPPALATMELLRGTPAAADDFAGTMRRLSAIAGGVPTARLRGGELHATARAVREWLDTIA